MTEARMRSKNDKPVNKTTSTNNSASTSVSPLDCTRHDDLTAQKVEVGIIFQEMLDTAAAAAYLAKNKVPISTALRVLTGSRRKKNASEN
ncbi:hypothetical protein [Janthinobacterium sp. RT4P48]|uniref:hypothetical protein n=1 Tax=Janthinobacterium sp. RT4P48 TaxID=3424188 RepID=UPI003F528FCE